jgi:hypothetical protein
MIRRGTHLSIGSRLVLSVAVFFLDNIFFNDLLDFFFRSRICIVVNSTRDSLSSPLSRLDPD